MCMVLVKDSIIEEAVENQIICSDYTSELLSKFVEELFQEKIKSSAMKKSKRVFGSLAQKATVSFSENWELSMDEFLGL